MCQFKPDNIKLLNELTHDDDESPSTELLKRIMVNFDHYSLFRSLYRKDHSIKVKCARIDDGILKFTIQFENNMSIKKILKINEMEYNNSKYNPVFTKINKHLIEVYFNKN